MADNYSRSKNELIFMKLKDKTLIAFFFSFQIVR